MKSTNRQHIDYPNSNAFIEGPPPSCNFIRERAKRVQLMVNIHVYPSPLTHESRIFRPLMRLHRQTYSHASRLLASPVRTRQRAKRWTQSGWCACLASCSRAMMAYSRR